MDTLLQYIYGSLTSIMNIMTQILVTAMVPRKISTGYIHIFQIIMQDPSFEMTCQAVPSVKTTRLDVAPLSRYTFLNL